MRNGSNALGGIRSVVRAAHLGLGALRARLGVTGLVGICLLLVHGMLALSAPYIVPTDPVAIDPHLAFSAPSLDHPFGTDQYGRDVFARVAYGGRIALLISLSSTALCIFCGLLLGLTTAYIGGWIDELVGRVVDAFFALPGILILLVIVAGFGSRLSVLVFATAVAFTPPSVRVFRAAALEVMPKEFVQAARTRGDRGTSIIAYEIAPNTFGVVLVQFAMVASWSVLIVSSASFLGLGIPPPTPDWGLMVAEARNVMMVAPWIVIFPSLALSSLIIGFNLAADCVARLTASGMIPDG